MLKLPFDDLLRATGMYRRDINHAIKHEGFPLPTVESGRELWWESEVQAWMSCRSTKGLPRWVSR
jgi:predicted DNA-binding transcriptional regulator AlpA